MGVAYDFMMHVIPYGNLHLVLPLKVTTGAMWQLPFIVHRMLLVM